MRRGCPATPASRKVALHLELTARRLPGFCGRKCLGHWQNYQWLSGCLGRILQWVGGNRYGEALLVSPVSRRLGRGLKMKKLALVGVLCVVVSAFAICWPNPVFAQRGGHAGGGGFHGGGGVHSGGGFHGSGGYYAYGGSRFYGSYHAGGYYGWHGGHH